MSRRRMVLAALGMVLSLLFSVGVALADEKEVCRSSYEQTQMLMRDGKLQAAHEQAIACLGPVCPAFTRPDCLKWMSEIEVSQPTVVLEVLDAQGRGTAAVRVELDGKMWLEALDGKAKAIDPGAHTLRYVMAGVPPIDTSVQILEAEKNKRLTVSFAAKDAKPPATEAPVPSSSGRTAGFVTGGAGIAVLGVGGVFGALALGEADAVRTACAGGCTRAGDSAMATMNAKATVADIGIGVGAAAVGVGAYLVLTSGPSKSSPTTGLRISPGFVGLGGAF